jgi:hypothetical protein
VSDLPDIALSLRQPWAWLVVQGHKALENRVWHRRPPARFWVHASKTMTRLDYVAATRVAREVDPALRLPTREELLFGGVVGLTACTGVLPYADPDLVEQGLLELRPWQMTGQYAYQLADMTPVPFVACKGALGFFRLPPDVLRELRSGARMEHVPLALDAEAMARLRLLSEATRVPMAVYVREGIDMVLKERG